MNIVLIGLAIFLFLDAFLSIILGKHYILLGLEYTPTRYKCYVEHISSLPTRILLNIRLVEITIGTILLWVSLL